MNIVIVTDEIGKTLAEHICEGLKTDGHSVKILASNTNRTDAVLIKASFKKAKIKRAFQGADIIHFIFPFKREKRFRRIANEMGIPTAISDCVTFS